MAGRTRRGPAGSPSTRFLVEVWWETRDRRWARQVLRGHVTELPDGRPRAFSTARQLTALMLAAARRRARPQDERST